MRKERSYLEGEGVDDLAQLMRLAIEGGRAVEETAATEHHPTGLQLLVSTVYKTPKQTSSSTLNDLSSLTTFNKQLKCSSLKAFF